MSTRTRGQALRDSAWAGVEAWGRHQRWWWTAVAFIMLAWLGYDLGRMVTRADLLTVGGPAQGTLTMAQLIDKANQFNGGRLIITSPNSARFLDRSGGAWEVPGFGDKINKEALRQLRSDRVLVDGDVDFTLQPVKTSPQDLLVATAVDLLFKLGFFAFIGFVLWVVSKQLRLNQRNGQFRAFHGADRPSVRIQDVAGHEGPKQEVFEFVDYLKDPKRYARAGALLPKGILLYGPPGNGKTLLAKAIAGEANASFLEQQASSFIEMYAGVGAERVRKLFAEARKHRPCVIFLDEIDAIGSARSGGSHDERVQTLNALLSEMDGFADNTGIVVIAATNRLEALDEALVRAGRFDRKVHVPLPSRHDREAILTVHARKLPAVDANLAYWAGQTTGFSGADLANLVNEAAMDAVRLQPEVLARDNGWLTVGDREFAKARERILMGAEQQGRRLSERERQFVAHHELGHALLRLLQGGAVEKVSILPRGQALGVTLQAPMEERHLMTPEEVRQELAVLMGGRAAEQVCLGTLTSGAADDMERASQLAREALLRYGWGSQGAYVPQEQALRQKLEEEAAQWVNEAFKYAQHAVTTHRKALEHTARLLLECEELDGAQLTAQLRLPPGAASPSGLTLPLAPTPRTTNPSDGASAPLA